MADRPSKPFNDAVENARPEPDKLKDPLDLNPPRDKDNADRRIAPPDFAPHGELNRAPHGMSGTRRNLPVPQHQKATPPANKEAGDLTREFKPIARGSGKDHGHDR